MTVPGTPAPLRTERLLLRQWNESDRAPFAAMNSDAEVMLHFPSRLDRDQSDAMVDRATAKIAADGWGLWAIEHDGGFVGFAGLSVPRFEAPFTPCVEVGWRLARPAWGNGYATEAARAVVAYGFQALDLPEIVSFTTVGNLRSRAVMERLGMRTDPADNFEHPSIPAGSPVRSHVLYRLPAGAVQPMG